MGPFEPTMLVVLFYFSLAGMAASVVIHLLAWGGVDASPAILWILPPGIVIVGSAFSIARRIGRSVGVKWFGLKVTWGCIPRGIQRVLVVLFLYGWSFAMVTLATSDDSGRIEARDGRYVLLVGRRVVREATAEEMHRRGVLAARLFSGVWIPLNAAAATIFFVRDTHRRRQVAIAADAEAWGGSPTVRAGVAVQGSAKADG